MQSTLKSMSGRSSPSFIVAVFAAVVAVVLFFGWDTFFPRPALRSERMVRAFASQVADEVGAFRKKLRRAELGGARAIDVELESRIERLDTLAEQALDGLDGLGGIPLRTLDNRIGRVEKRLFEAKTSLRAAAESYAKRLGDRVGVE